jgi:hypothetical protein
MCCNCQYSKRTLSSVVVRAQRFTNFAIKAIYKRYALTKINWVTVGTERPRPRMRNICSSPKYAAGGWKIQFPLSVRLKGTMAIGRFNLIPRPGLEPTVRIDICESAVLYQCAIKAFCTFIAHW